MEELFTLTYNGYTVEVTVAEQVDALKNTSDVSVGVRVKSAYKTGIIYPSGSIKVDGAALVTMNSAVSTHNIPITAYNTWYNVVKSGDSYTDSPWAMAGIVHNTDGSKSITLDLELRGYDAGGYLAFKVADSRTVTLTHIPRASTVGASDANIGAVSTLSVVRRSTAYTHTVAYKFGSLSGYIREDGSVTASAVKLTATSIPFLLPESFYAQIPNAKKGTCTLTVTTYSGSTQIGDAQTAKFTVTAAKSECAPEVSGTVADTNAATVALTGDKNILVRYVSNARCTVTATAKNSASVKSKTVGGVEVTGTTRTIQDIATGSVVFGCTDSRGYTASATVKKTLVPYIHLTANVTAKRTDPTSGKAKLTVTGKVYNGSFGAVSNALTVKYTVNGGTAVTLTPTLDGDSYTATANLTGLSYQNAHTLKVTVSDKLETVTKSVTVGKGIPVFDWGEEDFQFHVPVYVEGTDVAALADAAQTTANAARTTANAAAPKSALKCYGSLTDIGITEFPTTMSAVANAMPANSMVILDNRRIDGASSISTQTISDWGTTSAGVACIFKGYSEFRVTMLLLFGSSNAARGGFRVGNWTCDNDTVNWANYMACNKLYSGSLTSGSTTFSYYGYRLLVVVGRTATGNSLVSVTVPREAITTADVSWQLADNQYFVSFYLKYADDTVTLTFNSHSSAASGGCITAVYGVC